jgi:formylglycine-generating enzyme required for sulfatase activity
MGDTHYTLYSVFISLVVIFIFGLIIYLKIESIKNLINRRTLRKKFKDGRFDVSVIERATYSFLPPKCQTISPLTAKNDAAVEKEYLFAKIDNFIETDLVEKNLVILAGPGGGKTTSILNYIAVKEKPFLQKSIKLAAIPLNHSNAIDLITQIDDPQNTVVFLDALEEDPMAKAYHYERLNELLMLCKDFKRVILTSQSQFFSLDEEISGDSGVIHFNIEDIEQKRIYAIQKIYIAPFDDSDIALYVKQIYPFWRFSARKKAVQVALKAPFLREYPLFLNYIQYIIAIDYEIKRLYQMYDIIIEAWLELESSLVDKEMLKSLVESLALDLWTREGVKLKNRDAYQGLVELCKRWKPKIYSLLIRDDEGDFKFAHRSILEYLFVKKFVMLSIDKRPRIDWTEVMKSFLIEQMNDGSASKKLQRVCLSGTDLSETKLIDYDFSESNFERANLQDATVQKSNFQGVLFKGATFDASFIGKANIKNAILFETTLIYKTLKMKFVYIPEGAFMMGSPASEEGRNRDETLRQVVIADGFYMMTTPVTQKQWKIVMGQNPSNFNKLGGESPVENVSWLEAQEFIQKLNKAEEVNLYRLPTEAEWEYACRAGTRTRYFFGNDESKLSDFAWYKDNSNNTTHPVAVKEPNAWGLYDMLGNVWEWCQDSYRERKPDQVIPSGQPYVEPKLLRGGSVYNNAFDCRCANRKGRALPDYKVGNIGFRIIKTIPK